MILALVSPASHAQDEQPRAMWKVASQAKRGDTPRPPKSDGFSRRKMPVSNSRPATSSGIRRACSTRAACSLSQGMRAAVSSRTLSALLAAEPVSCGGVCTKPIAIASCRVIIIERVSPAYRSLDQARCIRGYAQSFLCGEINGVCNDQEARCHLENGGFTCSKAVVLRGKGTVAPLCRG